MKILDSNVFLDATYEKKHSLIEKEKLQKWDTPQDAPQRLQSQDRLELTNEFQTLFKDKQLSKVDKEDEINLSPKLMSMLRALEHLTGKKIDISSIKPFEPSQTLEPFEPSKAASSESVLQGWGIDYSYEKMETTQESLDFSAQGSVRTEDGKSMEFSLAFHMNSKVEKHESFTFKAGDALIDPLVLNFGTDIVSISEIKHEFDLDLDGKSDRFSFVGDGSGFLALDKNKDGKINDGSELFGPTKGNGFEELKLYDSDANNWIDENDLVYNDLLIWTKDEEGKENLYTLKSKDVGAIYLGRVETQQDLYSNAGMKEGELKESSIYLSEDGKSKTVQEIDILI